MRLRPADSKNDAHRRPNGAADGRDGVTGVHTGSERVLCPILAAPLGFSPNLFGLAL